MSSHQESLIIDPRILSILKIIWSGKWKIILVTLVTTLISVYYASKRPDLYNISIPIKKSPSSEFANLRAINNILLLEGYSLNINSEILVERFISEFKTLNELKPILEKNPYVKKYLANLDDQSKQKSLLKIVRSFGINHTNNNQNILVSFQWHDQNEGQELLNNLIKVTLEKVKKSIISEIEQTNKTISFTDKNRIKELENKKKSIIYF
jgi:LPS O-antigen subunit length determinant protein (WzzB/FepE family)